jgi:hypothetical protein
MILTHLPASLKVYFCFFRPPISVVASDFLITSRLGLCLLDT